MVLLFLFLLTLIQVSYSANVKPLVIATTTSVENSGLLNAVLPLFEQAAAIQVKVIAVGSGQALRLAREGNADLVITHSKKAEELFVQEGHGMKRIPFMRNRFIIVGPNNDPAGVKDANSAVGVFRILGSEKGYFISRGDNSGTHQKEMELWELANVTSHSANYLEVGAGMDISLRIANEKQAYILTDEGTYESMAGKLSLLRLYAGDPILDNVYSVIAVNPLLHKDVNIAGAQRFIDFITLNPAVRNLIETFKRTKDGRPLFYVIPPEEREGGDRVPVFGNIQSKRSVTIATGITLEQTGLLKKLTSLFEKETGISTRIVPVGTGQALRLAREGNVDLVWVHYPKAEEEFVREGYGLKRVTVFKSRFVIVGPSSDSAGAAGAKNVKEVFRRILDHKVLFVSRGDQSGTHMKELEIWKLVGMIPAKDMYWEAGRGMAETLRMADERQAYALAEGATYEVLRSTLSIVKLYEGDPVLDNPYTLISVNPAMHKGVHFAEAEQFIKFISTNSKVPKIVGSIRALDGRALFHFLLRVPNK